MVKKWCPWKAYRNLDSSAPVLEIDENEDNFEDDEEEDGDDFEGDEDEDGEPEDFLSGSRGRIADSYYGEE